MGPVKHIFLHALVGNEKHRNGEVVTVRRLLPIPTGKYWPAGPRKNVNHRSKALRRAT